jgi:RNA polymerase sigma-70 factor (ECF subfamily)
MQETQSVKQMSDEAILAASVAKPSLFEELVLRYQEAFLRRARAIIGNNETAEDIVQDAFMKMYLNATQFSDNGVGSFRSWAYKVVTNTALTYYARAKKERERTTALDEAHDYAEEGDVYEKMHTAHFERELVFLISTLPRKVSRILQWSVREGLSQDEIARREGVSVGAAKTRIHRAKKMLREALNKSQLHSV